MKIACKILVISALLIAAFLAAARRGDGPIAIVAGGPLTSGELLPSSGVDFSFVEDMETIEIQLLEPPRSRTTWVIFDEGFLYVPAGFMTLPVWKQWPHEALRDGRAIVRIDGIRYPFLLERVKDRKTWQKIGLSSATKYTPRETGSNPEPGPEKWNELWIFRLTPRPLTRL